MSTAPSPLFHATDLAAWRRWLMAHHRSERVLWLLFFKSQEDGPCISYGDALDEALCWGWIDSIVRRIDEKRYARKFTKRVNLSLWSSANLVRLRRLLAAGRVQAAGREAVSPDVLRRTQGPGPERKPTRPVLPVPVELERALAGSREAWSFFESLAPSYRRNYIGWVSSAKSVETRERRAREAVRLLAAGNKILLK